MRETLAWVWLLLAVSASMSEVITAGFFFLPFGIGAATAAVFAFAGFGVAAQLAAMLIATIASFVALRFYARKIQDKQYPKVGPDRLINEVGIVTQKIDHNVGTGEVCVMSEDWAARSTTVLEAGSKVSVLRTEGARLVVKPLDSSSTIKEKL